MIPKKHKFWHVNVANLGSSLLAPANAAGLTLTCGEFKMMVDARHKTYESRNNNSGRNNNNSGHIDIDIKLYICIIDLRNIPLQPTCKLQVSEISYDFYGDKSLKQRKKTPWNLGPQQVEPKTTWHGCQPVSTWFFKVSCCAFPLQNVPKYGLRFR